MKTRMLLAVGAALSLTAAANAQIMYGTNNLADTNFGTGGDQLIMFDFSNAAGWSSMGVIRNAAGAGIGGIAGLDFDGNVNNPTLYASVGFNANAGVAGDIYTINPANQQATLLGNVGTGINDLAWDPNTNDLYGVDGAGNLWRNLDSPADAQIVGNFGTGGLDVGLGFDAQGNAYVHDLVSDTIYTSNAGSLTTLTALHVLPIATNFSQGLYVDWSRDSQGYHAALDSGNLTSPNFTFGTQVNPGGYNFASQFPTNAANGLPEVEVGDLTRAPLPAPSTVALLGLGGLAAARRRRA